jgi:hypothetical protein
MAKRNVSNAKSIVIGANVRFSTVTPEVRFPIVFNMKKMNMTHIPILATFLNFSALM